MMQLKGVVWKLKGLLRPSIYVVIRLVLMALPLIWYALQTPSHYRDLVQGNVSSISMRFDGNGQLYKTSNPQEIATFEHAMNSVTLYSASAEAITGNSVCALLDQQGKPIGAVSFEGNDKVNINGKTYRMDPNPETELSAFFREFESDQNIVKQTP